MGQKQAGWTKARGFLSALGRDTRANTLAIMAIALIPLAGMVGGGVDISRMYIVKTRLQHACDAGALAGRKAMGGGSWTDADEGTAEQFFDANYDKTAYGLNPDNVDREFEESAGKVTGTASAVVPMTLMRIFGKTEETLSVSCDAEMRLPNTDVMFVLDVTGSMAQKASNSDPNTKIVALRKAVKCFYEIVARLDTDAQCEGDAPSGGTAEDVQIRFGFVPYDVNVNVGKLLPNEYLADRWNYQTRQANHTVTGSTNTYPNTVDSTGPSRSGTSAWGSYTDTGTSSYYGCPQVPATKNNVAETFTIDTAVTTAANGTRTWETRTYSTISISYRTNGSSPCKLQQRKQGTGTYTVVVHTQVPVPANTYKFDNWTYGNLSIDVSGLKAGGSNWNDSVRVKKLTNSDDPNATTTINWEGCVEERQTVKQDSYLPIPANAKDLDINTPPTPGNSATQWGPSLRGLLYLYKSTSGSGNWTRTPIDGVKDSTSYRNGLDSNSGVSYSCPTAAHKLEKWSDPSVFSNYVDNMWGGGNTYHDIGLIWGGRLMSPHGIFAAENAHTAKGGEIERHMIFMTDGDACTNGTNYNAYGLAWFDRRQTDASIDPGKTQTCSSDSGGGGILTKQVEARTAAVCDAIKKEKITLWVIYFGTIATTDIRDKMKACATSEDHFFEAKKEADLQEKFRSIANQISQLRLTQ
ncbi:MAG: Tad domain-containing protein [Sphingomonas sp.]|uniref:TadE/TadG family type IV pilus assembly protein n=1 Tax=Sphingomonas sp. TaxID=28214 RepID=UPI001AFE6FE6|nr:TadE/TadG family type IV pilus assembly protein [Sphingomonas sp.]MBO9622800.1 Tad domain-containing protein [Sphingomonas sp.]